MTKILGLDCGIASVGWAVLEYDAAGVSPPKYKIAECGVYCFEQPIVGGTGNDQFSSIKSAESKRIGHMHHMRRKKQKLSELRRLLAEYKLLPTSAKDEFARAMRRVSPAGQKPQITPYDLRAKSLKKEHVLTSDEFAVILAHYVSHPGPRSSSKQRGTNEDTEKGKIKDAVRNNAKYLEEGYRTVGEKLALDPHFQSQKHNRQNDWKFSVGRNDLLDEIKEVFKSQRKFGNKAATEPLLQNVLRIIEKKKEPTADYFEVEKCRFELGEPRAASRSVSFEKFRFVEHLVKLGLNRENEPKLRSEEIELAMQLFGVNAQTTFSDLRKKLSLPKDVLFDNVKKKDESNRDFAAGKGDSCHGTATLKTVLGEHWDSLASNSQTLDEICRVLSFATRKDVVERDLLALSLGEDITTKLITEYEAGVFDRFTEAASISAKAAANLASEMVKGLQYSDACRAFDYNHTAQTVNPKQNKNPIVKHAVREYLATIEMLQNKFGPFDEIRIEMARDVAWGAKKKLEESERNDKNKTANKKLKSDCKELLGGVEPSSFQVLKYRLLKEQGCKCIYTGSDLCEMMRDGFNGIEVDHVLPRSKFNLFGDRRNLVACINGANADKRNDTPYNWSLRNQSLDWNLFTKRVHSMKEIPKGKKRFLLMKSTEEIEDAFASRNLVDTQYAIKLLLAEIGALSINTHVVGRPGRLVSWLRGGWGLGRFKYNLQDKRVADDRHHAVDAIIVALIDQRTLQVATHFAKLNEESGQPRDRFRIAPPWPSLEKDVEVAIESISIVARQRRDAFKGDIHKDTIYGVKKIDGVTHIKVRKRVDKKLTLEDLKLFKDNSEKGHIKKLLEEWIANKDPDKSQPSWKYGINPDGTDRRMPIKKITLVSPGEVSVVPARLMRVNGKGDAETFGTYDRKDMVRVDVFIDESVSNKKTHVYVPIYPHQMTLLDPPNQYVKRGVPSAGWPILEAKHQFVTSLTKLDLIEITTSKRGTERGYFRSLHTGKRDIFVSPVYTLSDEHETQVGFSDLKSLRKMRIDRLGNAEFVESELRTWRGKVCI
jgi:CRISPR-associated endonuclease Csn1